MQDPRRKGNSENEASRTERVEVRQGLERARGGRGVSRIRDGDKGANRVPDPNDGDDQRGRGGAFEGGLPAAGRVWLEGVITVAKHKSDSGSRAGWWRWVHVHPATKVLHTPSLPFSSTHLLPTHHHHYNHAYPFTDRCRLSAIHSPGVRCASSSSTCPHGE